MAKKKPVIKKKASQPGVEYKHSGKALSGKSTSKPVSFDPTAPLSSAPVVGADPSSARSRPSKSRYPISTEEFEKLQNLAASAKVATVTKESGVADKPVKHSSARSAAPSAAAPVAAAPVLGANFDGIGNTGWSPPDCTLAVGPSHVLASINSSVAIYNKTGTVALAPRTLAAWWSSVITNAKIFDPKALFDQHSQRWILIAAAMPNSAAQESYFLLSISKTSDPLGGWWHYKLNAKVDGSTDTQNWADYPGLGVDASAIYLTANMFQFGGGFAYAKVRILKKAPLLAGLAATWVDFVKLKNPDNTLAFTVAPCHTFGAPQVQYFVNTLFAGSANKVTVWTLNNPITSPALTKQSVTTTTYGQPPLANQKGGGTALNSGDVRVQNAVFRGGSVWCNFATVANWNEPGVNRAAIFWLQLNPSTGTVVQQGVYGGSGQHYFYPASAIDTNGGMGMVFCRTGATEFASIRYTGRKASEPLGSLQPSALLMAGKSNMLHMDGAEAADDPVPDQ